ncbi:MAG TPA: S-layer homology domain-containing protein [Mycobacteriales bacterium]|nr:S-layer homology domain-containing protein [Mycobacteriales bacterium]
MRTRSAALLAAATLVAAAVPASAAPAPRSTDRACPASIQEDGFPDVPRGNVHEASVDCVVHWGVASGRSSTSYAPAAVVERGQMATFLVRLLDRTGAPLPPATRDHFTDDATSAHRDSIDRLAEAGLVGGKGGGRFAPAEPVTRAQMAAFLVRVHDHRARQGGRPPLPPGDDAFPDDDASPLAPQIDAAAAAGVAGGYADGTYRPGLPVARDQMAGFLARVLDLVVEQGLAQVPPGPRVLTATGFAPYASAGPVVLHSPADLVEVVGYHEANHDGARAQAPAAGGPRSLVLPSRGRGTDPRSAADVVADPSREVRSPVTGTVKRAASYVLYCRYTDQYLVVEPDARPGWEVKVLHVQGLRVRAGDRVTAGQTVVADGPRQFPFRSQVDDSTAAPHWPHVHVEVVDLGIPDRPGGGGSC